MLTIRSAAPTDMPGVVSLLADAGLPHQDLHPQASAQFLVACSGEKVVGCIGIECYASHALMRSLAVHPSFQRRGVAFNLVLAVEERARKQDTASIYLLTMSATDFFIARGYKHVVRENAPLTIQKSAQFTALCPSQAECLYKNFVNNSGMQHER
jgi:amino-acid N-acetyltransferase